MPELREGLDVVRLEDGKRGKVRLQEDGFASVYWQSRPGEPYGTTYTDVAKLCQEWAYNDGKWLGAGRGATPATVPTKCRLTPPPSTTPTTRPNYYRVPCLVRLPDEDAARAETPALVECQDLIEALDLDFNCGNVLKYLFRCGRKTPDRIADLRKARRYLDFAIDALTR